MLRKGMPEIKTSFKRHTYKAAILSKNSEERKEYSVKALRFHPSDLHVCSLLLVHLFTYSHNALADFCLGFHSHVTIVKICILQLHLCCLLSIRT